MEKLAIVFDWDDVVFNTAAFKESLAAVLSKRGMPRKDVLGTVGIAKDAHGYNPAIHARMIVDRVGGNERGISRLIWSECRSSADKLIFPDALQTLRDIHRNKVPMRVLSAGRKRFQRTRIYGSKLAHFFRGIHIVDVTSPDAAVSTKINVLARLTKSYEHIVFLDDRPKTIAGIYKDKDLQGKVLPILVWRKKGSPPGGLPVVRRLSWPGLKRIAIHKRLGPY